VKGRKRSLILASPGRQRGKRISPPAFPHVAGGRGGEEGGQYPLFLSADGKGEGEESWRPTFIPVSLEGEKGRKKNCFWRFWEKKNAPFCM